MYRNPLFPYSYVCVLFPDICAKQKGAKLVFVKVKSREAKKIH